MRNKSLEYAKKSEHRKNEKNYKNYNDIQQERIYAKKKLCKSDLYKKLKFKMQYCKCVVREKKMLQ